MHLACELKLGAAILVPGACKTGSVCWDSRPAGLMLAYSLTFLNPLGVLQKVFIYYAFYDLQHRNICHYVIYWNLSVAKEIKTYDFFFSGAPRPPVFKPTLYCPSSTQRSHWNSSCVSFWGHSRSGTSPPGTVMFSGRLFKKKTWLYSYIIQLDSACVCVFVVVFLY